MDENNGLKTTYPALSFRFLLEEIMTWAVQETARKIVGTPDITGLITTPKMVSLHGFQESTLITYQTAIALNLSHQWNKPVNDIAAHIARYIKLIANGRSDMCLLTLVQRAEKAEDIPTRDPPQHKADAIEEWPLSTFTRAIAHTLTLAIHPKGYVQCHLSATTLSMWLQAMVQAQSCCTLPNGLRDRTHHGPNVHSAYSGTVQKDVREITTPRPGQRLTADWTISDIPFAVFHAHARCCSILRLSHTIGQITLQRLGGDQDVEERTSMPLVLRPPWTIIEPKLLPWQVVLSPQNSPQQWAIAHPLLAQIITSLDQFVALTSESLGCSQNPSRPLSQKRSQKLSQKPHGTKLLKEITALSTAIHRFDAEVVFHEKISNRGQGNARTTIASLDASYVPYLGLILIAQGLLNNLLTYFLDQSNIYLDIPDEL